MSQAVTLNGVGYTIPDVGENDWGQNVTDFLVAIPSGVLQKSGGTFTLTAEVDFGTGFGLKSLYYKSRTANPATAGQVRFGVSDVVSWRNNANGGNLDLGVDGSDDLIFASNKVVTVEGGFAFVGTNSYANQKGIRFMEQTGNGSNYMEIVAPDALTASVTLKLPDGDGSGGQVLSTDGSGNLSWINAAGGGTINSGVQGRLAVYPSNGTTLDDSVTMANPVIVDIAAHGQTTTVTIPDGGQATASFVLTEGTQTINGAKTLSGATVVSNSSTSAFRLSANDAFKIDSTNVLVSIGTSTMTHPLHISKAVVGSASVLAHENTDGANAASHAQLQIITGGASAGDPFITLYNGVQNISIGMDNSDSDALCITAAATLNGTNILRLTVAGAMTLASSLTVTTNGITITAGGLTVTAGGATISAGALTVAATSNQIVLGTTNTTTISATAPSASRVYTMPDVGGAADFVMTAGNQTIGGTKTFSAAVLFPDGTVSAPSIAFSSDTNTGLYWPAADQISLVAGGSDVIVGIKSGTDIVARFQDGTVSLPSVSFQSDANCGMYRIGTDNIGFAVGGSKALDLGTTSVGINASGVSIMTFTATAITAQNGVPILSATAASSNIGSATLYFNDISYKTLTDRGCLPWCDDGVELCDGTRVSDLAALCQISKHPTEKTVHGLPKLDYRTFPKKAYRPADRDGVLIARDADDAPVEGADGIEMTMMFGVMIGAFKEVSSKLTDLDQRIQALEKVA